MRLANVTCLLTLHLNFVTYSRVPKAATHSLV
jgi:hypothetical protein